MSRQRDDFEQVAETVDLYDILGQAD